MPPNARAFRSQPRATRPMSRDSRRRTPRVPLTDPRRVTRASCCRGRWSRSTFRRRRRPSCSPRGEPSGTTRCSPPRRSGGGSRRRRASCSPAWSTMRCTLCRRARSACPVARCSLSRALSRGTCGGSFMSARTSTTCCSTGTTARGGTLSGSFSRCVARCRASRIASTSTTSARARRCVHRLHRAAAAAAAAAARGGGGAGAGFVHGGAAAAADGSADVHRS